MNTESADEHRYRTLFERAPVAIWDEDFSAVKEFLTGLLPLGPEYIRQHLETKPHLVAEAIRLVRVRHVNRIAREFYGAATEEDLIRELPRLFDATAEKVFIDEIVSLAEGNSTFSAELTVSTLSGDRRLVQMNVSVLPTQSGDWSQVVVAFTDLTERRRLEQSLRLANDMLQRVNSDLEQFAYAAAHDLREPLRTITLYAQLLQKRNPESSGPEAETALNYILDNSTRMNSLLGDLLTYAQTMEPRDLTRCPLIDAKAIADEVITSIAGAIEQAQARVVVSDELPAVPVQAGHLRQLFQNLIVNAIKYRSPERVVEVTLTGVLREDWTVFCVADNGIGISPNHHNRIFGIFKRLHNTEVEGTGIGLALCKSIVEQYGGRIWVESEVGAGSRFMFRIPAPSSEVELRP